MDLIFFIKTIALACLKKLINFIQQKMKEKKSQKEKAKNPLKFGFFKSYF